MINYANVLSIINTKEATLPAKLGGLN